MDRAKPLFYRVNAVCIPGALAGVLPREVRQFAIESVSIFHVWTMVDSLIHRCLGVGNTAQEILRVGGRDDGVLLACRDQHGQRETLQQSVISPSDCDI